jgi:signal transduction histidine kinase
MQLSQFILDNLEPILQKWEDFARSLEPGRRMSVRALRNDAERMLRFVAADMEAYQTRQEQFDKSVGTGPELPAGQQSAAQDHGLGRATDRFSLIEMVSEYRALRASVARLWLDAPSQSNDRDCMVELVRFNEALDQILAESVVRFTSKLDTDADLFTASIGHDLRNPLNAVVVSSQVLSQSTTLSEQDRAAVIRIERSAGRITGMLNELRDFTRTRLGALVELKRERCDLGEICRRIVDELSAAYPTRRLSMEQIGEMTAEIDSSRVAQLLSNLVGNALQHGSVGGPVTVVARGASDSITISIHNKGPAIAADQLKTIFDPLNRGPQGRSEDPGSLGLGLYIARQIALAHGGNIEVVSTLVEGTTFSAHLSRRAS